MRHVLLKDIQLKSGDKISLVKKKDDNVPYGIDFIELEQAPVPVAQGENSISIVDKGASANDDSDDTAALLAAVKKLEAMKICLIFQKDVSILINRLISKLII